MTGLARSGFARQRFAVAPRRARQADAKDGVGLLFIYMELMPVSEGEAHNEAPHRPVMTREALDALNIAPNGIYMDATFGRGGHSEKILAALGPDGALFALDQDPEAVSAGKTRFNNDGRLQLRHANFAELAAYADDCSIKGRVNGVLFDLGVSSPQLDNPQRGFSFSNDGPLDMRMNPHSGVRAAAWLNDAAEEDIALILKDFGEERFARRIARAIVAHRRSELITRTAQLAQIVASAVPTREAGKHPATRSFQALRMHINRELQALRDGLAAAAKVLAPGGRLVVISFHSLEDRLVKRFLRDQSGRAPRPRQLPLPEAAPPLLQDIHKPQYPAENEVQSNPRARSAVMRVATRTGFAA